MTNIFFNFWRKGGLALALAAILFCYTTLPENVAITHTQGGQPKGYVSKEMFFYTSAGILLGFNLLLNTLRDQLVKLNLLQVNPSSAWAKRPEQLRALLTGWFNGLLAFINTYLVFVLLGLYNVNANRGQRLDMNYDWLLIFGVVAMLFILLFLPLKLLYTNPSVEND